MGQVLVTKATIGGVTTLYVTYDADDNCEIKEAHLFVGEVGVDVIPTGNSGNPKIGQFPVSWE